LPIEADQATSGMNVLRAEALLNGSIEDAKQLATVDRDLRPAVAGVKTARLLPDQLPAGGVERQMIGENTGRAQLVPQPQLGQLANGVGQDVDPNSELANFRRGFVNVHVPNA